MKGIRNKRRFAFGVILTLMAVASMMVAVMSEGNDRFVVGTVIFLSLACVNYFYAFRQRDVIEEIVGSIDERDSYLAMKSCQMAMQIVNYILLAVLQVSLVLYAAFDQALFLVVSITLCAVLVVMFVVTLVVNSKYEKSC